jgi:UDP-2-acetamido-2,6-beta-L-arabino-hexul-4-ose reductase
MKVLITGADGFIAKNLRETLQRDESLKLYLFSKDDSLDILEAYLKEVDFVYHLAGVNRPKDNEEFYEGNTNLTRFIIDVLKKNKKIVPLVLSSSTQAILDNDYGKSKLQAENIVLEYSKEFAINSYVFRLPNVFGKWSKPNYNSVISTWCYNISHNIDIELNDETYAMKLVYVDDVVNEFVKCLDSDQKSAYSDISTVYVKTLGEIRDLLIEFKENRNSLVIPNVGSGFERALYGTYLSYLDTNDFSYKLNGHEDDRGTFYEILKTKDAGQFSLSTTKAGITRGNHYHNTKNEKFLVVKGKARIEFRHIFSDEIISYEVSGSSMEVVEMIPGYTHNIKNIGDDELLLFLWANEQFDQSNPDTYFLKV